MPLWFPHVYSPVGLAPRVGGGAGVRGQKEFIAIYDLGLMNLLMIPEREETPIFIIAKRRKTFTVLGLILMRAAISLLAKPRIRSFTASPSRGVKWYWSQALSMSTAASGRRSRSRANEDSLEALPGNCTSKNR